MIRERLYKNKARALKARVKKQATGCDDLLRSKSEVAMVMFSESDYLRVVSSG